jgi:hypothetical protein
LMCKTSKLIATIVTYYQRSVNCEFNNVRIGAAEFDIFITSASRKYKKCRGKAGLSGCFATAFH